MVSRNRRSRRNDRFGRTARAQRGMSRRRFLGTAAAGVGAAMVGASGIVSANTPPWIPIDTINIEVDHPSRREIIVWPTGNDSKDRENIQWAIDNVKKGGEVKLKSVNKMGVPTDFNFGEASVIVRRSLTLTGVGNATITGGSYALQVGAMEGTPLHDVIIEKINFEYFVRGAIRGIRYNSLVVQDCDFSYGIIKQSSVSKINILYAVGLAGIGWPGLDDPPTSPPSPPPGHIGTTHVINNTFDLFPNGDNNGGPAVADTGYATAVFLADINEGASTYSDITIEGNNIMNPGMCGIAIYGCPGINSLDVIGNTIEHNTTHLTGYYDFTANNPYDWSNWMKSNPTEKALSMSMGIYATGFRVGTAPGVPPPVKNDGYPQTGNIVGNTILNCPTRGIVLANAENYNVDCNYIEMVDGDAGIVITGDHYVKLDGTHFPPATNNNFCNNTIVPGAMYLAHVTLGDPGHTPDACGNCIGYLVGGSYLDEPGCNNLTSSLNACGCTCTPP